MKIADSSHSKLTIINSDTQKVIQFAIMKMSLFGFVKDFGKK